ncbi:carbonic anhydrase [Sphingomonas sp. MMS24-J13]|uniref:carbonic anhydrase n=1 Tax=Sphingomonas sp. MMS24-J13 TaxID=3238686 RepID=UPI00384C7F5D
MNELIGRVLRFEKEVYSTRSELYGQLSSRGQSPKALMISCADSRIVPEHVMQAEPGDLFVCRNAGNIVPPFAQMNGGVSSTVEYAVAALGVRDIIICGHSDCGAMKAVADPHCVHDMPNVAAWLRHSSAAHRVVRDAYPDLGNGDLVRAISMENVVAQLSHLRTHPTVAAGVARGEISLHGWFVDIHAGQILALDGETGQFVPVQEGVKLPIAQPAERRIAADFSFAVAAE